MSPVGNPTTMLILPTVSADRARRLIVSAAALLLAGPGFAQDTASTTSSKAVVMSPFEVNTDKDNGFMATNAGTATKLGLDLKDLAAPYSVMTGEFLQTMGITDLQDAVMWSTNGSPVLDGQGADLWGGGSTSTTSSMYNIRGFVINAGQQRNFFLTSGLSDTYNVERIDFGRGPNAVLFNVGANEALGGGISTQGKRARFDRDATTLNFRTGSWDYYRGTIDVNQILVPGKLAIRTNILGQKRNGWLQGAFENRQGITLTGTYRFNHRTELRIEAVDDKDERSRVAIPLFDNLSGWNGTTVFDGQVTNNMLKGLAPTADGGYLTKSYGGNGQYEGVSRFGGDTYVYDPATHSIMNWVDMATTRRGDENQNVPIYLDGQMWSRFGNGYLLPLGNSGGSGGNTRTPNPYSNGGSAPFLYAAGLPSDRFARATANSHFRLPGKRMTLTPADPLFTQHTEDVNFGLTHQFSDNLFVEVSGDANRTKERSIAGHLGFRTGYIDLNKLLPNGAPNPHFLDAYSQSDGALNYRTLTNYGLRAVVNFRKNAGKWGDYTFNLSGNVSGRSVKYRRKYLSLTTTADPREWQSGAQRVRMRYYWNDSARPYINIAPITLYDVDPSADGNSFARSTQTIRPRWILGDWSDRTERTYSGIFAFAARYFHDRLIVSPGVRVDNQMTKVRLRPTDFGFLPTDPNWDGETLDGRYWRPDAPSDWLSLSYIPKKADGTPLSTAPIPAYGNRPTVRGVNGVDSADPVYANDRFRNDYSPPRFRNTIVSKTAGITYHVMPWLAAKLSYGDSYKPSDPGRLTLTGETADPEKGVAYEAGLTFSLFHNRLAITPRYYFNRKENVLGTPPTSGPINSLMARNAWDDPSPSGRNPFNYSEVLGGDYTATRNDGYEIEMVGSFARGWRVMANFGTGQRVDYDRYKHTQAYVMGRKDEFAKVLAAAGGKVDTSGAYKSLQSASAPGYAVPDPAITNNMITAAGGYLGERDGAVRDYNDIWQAYDAISTLQDTIGIRRMTLHVYTDYAFQDHWLRGLRVGLGWQYVDKDVAGYRSADTLPNPNYDAAKPASPSNLPWIDDPKVDANTPVWVKRPSEVEATLSYSGRLNRGYAFLRGKEYTVQLTVHNLLNKQAVFYQDDGVVPRSPNGNASAPNRVAQPGRIALFEQPINFELAFTLKL